MAEEIVIPDKPAFKSSEVCELLKLQPYVLKSWENEFKDLGIAKTAGGPRVYRRTDVQRAVRIRELMLREGLTLAGVRRRLEQEAATADVEDELIAEIAASSSATAPADKGLDRERVLQVKQGLRALLDTLSKPAAPAAPAATDSVAPSAPSTSKSARQRARKGSGAGAEDAARSTAGEAAETAPEASPASPPAIATPAHDDAGPSSAAIRELTVVADEAPSLFGDDDPMAARDDARAAQVPRKRAPRGGAPSAE